MFGKLKALAAAIIGFAALTTAVSAAQYDPYVLCYNSGYNGSHEGIFAGWVCDNRAGNPRASIMGGYVPVVDVSRERTSALYRDLTYTDEGIIRFETAVSFATGFNGLSLRFDDKDGNTVYLLTTIDNAWCVKIGAGYMKINTPAQASGSFRIRLRLDLDNGRAWTMINDTDCGSVPLLSDNLYRFGFYTSKQDVLTFTPSGVKMLANYTLFDDFWMDTGTNAVPYKWSSADPSKASVSGGEGRVSNGGTLMREFDRSEEKVAYEMNFRLDANADLKLALRDGTRNVLTFESRRASSFAKNENYTRNIHFYANDEMLEEYYNGIRNDLYLENHWYRLRIELDFKEALAVVKLSGRVMAYAELPYTSTGIDNLTLTGTGSAKAVFDDINLFNLVEHEDYVPEPVIPEDDGYVVGLNVCSLWSYTSAHGWSCISPYPENRPVLGYYDEGMPETADWEIKFLAEHGVDFQAFCWYADQTAGPQKGTRNASHLHNGFMNAKYADMTKYCLIWEAANGSHPKAGNGYTASESFRRFFVTSFIENYLKDDRYMIIDNRPVILCFSYGSFISDMGGNAAAKAEIDYFRDEVRKLGYDDLILISSNGYYNIDSGADGAVGYNYGTGGYSIENNIAGTQRYAKGAVAGGGYAVPLMTVGFNSLAWHGTRYPNASLEDFSLMADYCKEYLDPANDAKYNRKYDWQKNFLMLSTWNEYGEGTYIMPCEELHGFGYLDIIREKFTKDDVPHNDDVPNAAQLARIDKNYPNYVRLLRRQDSYEPDYDVIFKPVVSYDFSDPTAYATGNLSNVVFKNGTVSGTTKAVSTTGKESKNYYEELLGYVESDSDLGVELGQAGLVRVKMCADRNTTAYLFYTTEEEPVYTIENSVKINVKASDTPEDYYIMMDNALVGKTLRSFRIMPAFNDRKMNVSEAPETRINSVHFEVAEVAFLSSLRLFIDFRFMGSKVYVETRNGSTLFPFDPAQAVGYLLGVHFEWDYDAQTLTVYSTDGDDTLSFTMGEAVMHTTKNGDIPLANANYLSDGLPMIDLEAFCGELGYTVEYKDSDIYVETIDCQRNSHIFNRPEDLWDFQYNSTYGFSGNAKVDASDGTLNVTSTDGDPRIVVEGLSIPAEKYIGFEVCMAFEGTSSADNVSFFWTTDASGSWSENKHALKRLGTGDSRGEYRTYRMYIYNDCTAQSKTEQLWSGNLTGIRFDPFNCAGATCRVKYIKLIENPDYEEPHSAAEDDIFGFTSITFDAEDGVIPFVMGTSGSTCTIVPDPVNPGSGNHVYRIDPGSAGGKYYGPDYNMYWEAGATYKITADVCMGDAFGGDGTTQYSCSVMCDPRFDDPKQYVLSANANYYDHISGSANGKTNTPEWISSECSFTVPSYCFLRGGDQLHIYANPVNINGSNNYSLIYYLDNLTITKTTGLKLTVTNPIKRSSIVTVSGSTGIPTGTRAHVIIAAYDASGRLIKTAVPDTHENASFSLELKGCSTAASVKVYFWEGLNSLTPLKSVKSYTLK